MLYAYHRLAEQFASDKLVYKAVSTRLWFEWETVDYTLFTTWLRPHDVTYAIVELIDKDESWIMITL